MRILTTKETFKKIGVSRTKLWHLTKEGRFPQPVKNGSNVGYVEHEVDAWIEARMAEREKAVA
tara:strand:+ start:2282 stop:2470 length:189 start_codon:yes stop_codon:yes gene_type:complete